MSNEVKFFQMVTLSLNISMHGAAWVQLQNDSEKNEKGMLFISLLFLFFGLCSGSIFSIYQSSNPYLPCTGYWTTAVFIHWLKETNLASFP